MERFRAKRFYFKIDNYTDEEFIAVMNIKYWTKPDVICAVAGVEHVNEGEGRKIKGYIHLKETTYNDLIMMKISRRMKIEVARGSERELYKKCTKEGADNIVLDIGRFSKSVKRLAKDKKKSEDVMISEDISLSEELKELEELFGERTRYF